MTFLNRNSRFRIEKSCSLSPEVMQAMHDRTHLAFHFHSFFSRSLHHLSFFFFVSFIFFILHWRCLCQSSFLAAVPLHHKELDRRSRLPCRQLPDNLASQCILQQSLCIRKASQLLMTHAGSCWRTWPVRVFCNGPSASERPDSCS